MKPAAVIFDLDGVLVDSEQLWDRIRRDVVAEHHGVWTENATRDMMGMSTPEWASYLVEQLSAQLEPDDAAAAVIERMAQHYRKNAPVLPHATETVRLVARTWPVAIASSAPPRIIRAFLEATNLVDTVRYTISSEDVGTGKPAPDVYLEAARGLGLPANQCAAVEDSSNGLRAAFAAGATVFAVPNAHFPPAADALSVARRVLNGVGELPAALWELANSTTD